MSNTGLAVAIGVVTLVFVLGFMIEAVIAAIRQNRKNEED